MFGPTVGHYCKPPSAAPMMHHDALCLDGFQHISKKKGGCQDMFVLFLSEDAWQAPDKKARLLLYCKPPSAASMMHHVAFCFQHIS